MCKTISLFQKSSVLWLSSNLLYRTSYKQDGTARKYTQTLLCAGGTHTHTNDLMTFSPRQRDEGVAALTI